ncbi:polysaccharide lyase [Mycobacterium sp. LTG2003]
MRLPKSLAGIIAIAGMCGPTACGGSSSATPVPTPCPVSVASAAGVCPVPPDSEVVFSGDYDTGDLSQWAMLQTRGWNKAPGKYCGYNACVLDGGAGHVTAARFEIRDGDVPPFGGGIRSEVRTAGQPASGASVREGDERWYELSVRFDESFRNPRTGPHDWFVIMQWLPDDDSIPALTLQVSLDGRLELGGDARSVQFRRPIGDIDRGSWVDYVLHVRFSADPDAGFVEVWRNGQLSVPLHHRPTLGMAESSYLKQGVYRSPDSIGTQVLWHDGLRVIDPGPRP